MITQTEHTLMQRYRCATGAAIGQVAKGEGIADYEIKTVVLARPRGDFT